MRDVEFARLADGRVAVSGRAAEVEAWRTGQKFAARATRLAFAPGSEALRPLGTLLADAPQLTGELAARHAVATGGLVIHAARGDEARLDHATWAGDFITSHAPVSLRGPGYALEGSALKAASDGSSLQLTHAHGTMGDAR